MSSRLDSGVGGRCVAIAIASPLAILSQMLVRLRRRRRRRRRVLFFFAGPRRPSSPAASSPVRDGPRLPCPTASSPRCWPTPWSRASALLVNLARGDDVSVVAIVFNAGLAAADGPARRLDRQLAGNRPGRRLT